jgi:hypothetical protein
VERQKMTGLAGARLGFPHSSFYKEVEGLMGSLDTLSIKMYTPQIFLNARQNLDIVNYISRMLGKSNS